MVNISFEKQTMDTIQSANIEIGVPFVFNKYDCDDVWMKVDQKSFLSLKTRNRHPLIGNEWVIPVDLDIKVTFPKC